MALVEWADTRSVSVKIIDEQHKGLIVLIDDLFNAMSEGQAKSIMSGILSELAEYTVEHFATEERMMTKLKYPKIEEHKKQHKDFVAKVVEFKGGFEAGSAFLSIKVMEFLKNWLVEHIMGTDQQLGEFLKERGVD